MFRKTKLKVKRQSHIEPALRQMAAKSGIDFRRVQVGSIKSRTINKLDTQQNDKYPAQKIRSSKLSCCVLIGNQPTEFKKEQRK